MKRFLVPIAAGLTALAALTACGSGSGSGATAGRQTLTVWVLSDNGPYFKEVAADFEKAHPDVSVKVVEHANEPYKTAIQVAMASNNPPDVFHNDPGEASFKFVRDGQVLDLTEAGSQDGWARTLAPGTVASVTLDGKVWGVPWTQQSKFMFYNKDLLAANGLSAPATLADLLGACRTLKAKGVTPISFGNSERWPGIHYMTILNQKVVGDTQIAADYAMTPAAGQLFNDPGYVQALQYLKDMQGAGCFNDGVNSVSPEISQAMFYTGKAAMNFCGTWCLGVMDSNGFEGKYGTFPFPAIEGGKGDQGIEISGPTVMQVSAKTKVEKAATDFLAFLVSQPQQARLVTRTQRIPTDPSAVKGLTLEPALADVIGQLGAAKGTTLWLDSATEAGVSDAYQNAVQGVLGGTVSPAQAMDQVREAAVATKAKLGR